MVLEGLEKEICLLVDQVISIDRLQEALPNRFEALCIEEAIQRLKDQKLLIQIGNEMLFLAVPRNLPKAGKYMPFWLGYIEV